MFVFWHCALHAAHCLRFQRGWHETLRAAQIKENQMITVLKIMVTVFTACAFQGAANRPLRQTVRDASAGPTGRLAVPYMLPSEAPQERRKQVAPCH
jgi:hypothetical protein